MPATEAPLVRRATREDAAAILDLVDGLADYEKLTPPDEAAKLRLIEDMFGPRPRLDVFLAEYAGKAAGYAFLFETYSSFRAAPVLYLEDLFVMPEYRSKKIGYALFTTVIDEAKARGCCRMEWSVLDWNQLAIDFYHRLGGRQKREWLSYRIDL